MTAKEIVFDRLIRVPDTLSLRQIREEIDALIRLDEALEDVRAGRMHTQEEVDEMSKSWITEVSGQTVP
jgi:predicted transcriptional regulator